VLSFYQGSLDEYFAIVRALFGEVANEPAMLAKAREYAALKGSRSPRVARQFWLSFRDIFGGKNGEI